MRAPHVIAVLCADLHMTLEPPPCRAGEKDWLATQAGYLEQMTKLCTIHQCPIICAGDVFDKWDSSVELVNFLSAASPQMYSVAGQHDLPHHNLDDIQRTAYWTLCETDTLLHIQHAHRLNVIQTMLFAFSWGQVLKRPIAPSKANAKDLVVAVIHKYIWRDKLTGYVGAPDAAKIQNLKGSLVRYDVAVVGDNHKPFDILLDNCHVFNCGGFMRRKSDEINHKPSVGLLYSDGNIKRHYLDISKDVFTPVEKAPKFQADNRQLKVFLSELGSVVDNESIADFVGDVRKWLEAHPELRDTARVLMEAVGI